jgi:hypothetical protein
LDPNLIAQGIPPDRRADSGATLYAPIEGTPPPPEQQPAAPADAPPPSADTPPPDILPNGDPDAPGATPSSFATNGSGAGPSVEVAQYNPQTGAYMASDGHLYRQSNLTTASAPASWTDLMAGPKT